MNAKTRPGLQIYSQGWLSEVATHVAEPLLPVVRAICEAYQLGDTDTPNDLARLIEKELSAQCSQYEHQIYAPGGEDDEQQTIWVHPDGMEFDVVSGYWYYKTGATYYSPDEILGRRRRK